MLCEKPLANTVEEAEAMTAAAEAARAQGVRSMVGFTYRRVPAIALARRLVADGKIGDIRHVRAQYLQDWIVDPEAPLTWRLQKDKAGSGALGDIGAHRRPHAVHHRADHRRERCWRRSSTAAAGIRQRAFRGGGTERGEVTVDDAAVFLGRFTGGALATFEATRFATGRKNSIRIEINGSAGSLAFDFEDMERPAGV